MLCILTPNAAATFKSQRRLDGPAHHREAIASRDATVTLMGAKHATSITAGITIGRKGPAIASQMAVLQLGHYSVAFGGFLPNLASYWAANFPSSSGWQTKHCDSGRLCCWHQSPFCW